jgi:hypothetical protein
MKGVKRNSDREQDVQMRRLINDPDPRYQPLKILEQKIPVLEKAEHAQVHANARDQPAFLGRTILGLSDFSPEPEIHGSGGEEQRGERWIPGAVKNVAGDDQDIFSQFPAAQAPVERHHDNEENDEGK